jgi:hypothetical protein
MMGDIRAIGAFIMLGAAAALIYFVWAASTDRDVYGHMGRPSRAVAAFMIAAALVAAIGVGIIYNI